MSLGIVRIYIQNLPNITAKIISNKNETLLKYNGITFLNAIEFIDFIELEKHFVDHKDKLYQLFRFTKNICSPNIIIRDLKKIIKNNLREPLIKIIGLYYQEQCKIYIK